MAEDLSILSIEVDASAEQAGKGIDSLSAALGRLNASSKLTRTINNLTSLSSALSKLQGYNSVASTLTRMGNAMQNLGSIQKLSGLNSAINTLKKLPDALSALSGTDLVALNKASQSLVSIASGLQALESPKGLTSTITALRNIPKVMQGLESADLTKFAAQMERVRTAIAPLAAEMEKVSKGFSALPANIQRAVAANAKLTASNSRLNKSYGVLGTGISSFYTKMLAQLYIVQRVADYLGRALSEYNAFVENVNLFSVSMGEFTEQANRFTQALQDVLGVDASEAMRNMGIIQNLVTSFGVAEDMAYTLSKNLTQLGYDFASFFNISVSDAFTKLQAAISGELEPIRRLGVDISEARLQQELFALGINTTVKNLSQADKAILRYIAIMKQTGNAQTDMARTLNSPANMIRVFQSQLDLLTRSIGSLFIPMLNAVLPPLIAFVKIVREGVEALAAMFGVSIEFADIKNTAVSAGSAVSGIGDAAADAKKRMDYLIGGFDELNVMSQDAASSAAGSGFGSGLGGITLPEYDMFEGLVESRVDEWVEKMRQIMKTMLPIVLAIGGAFLGWKAVDFVTKAMPLIKLGAAAVLDYFLLMSGQLDLLGGAGQKLYQAFAAVGKPLGLTASAVAGIAAAAVVVAVRFAQLYATSEKFRSGLERIVDIVTSIGSGFVGGFMEVVSPLKAQFAELADKIMGLLPPTLVQAITTFFRDTLPEFIRALDLDFGDLALTILGIGLLFVPGGQVPGLILLGFEVISVALRGLGLLSDEQLDTIKNGFKTVFTWIGKFVGGVFNSIFTFYLEVSGGIIDFLTGVFTGNWELAWEGIKQLALAPIRAIAAFFEQVFGVDIIEVFRNGINKVVDILNDFIDWVNEHLHFEFDGLEIAGQEIIPPFDFQLFTLPKIPHLADGGVLTSPRMVLAGEYAGARSNPEIVTPQNLMRSTVEDANSSMAAAIVAAIQALEATMAAKDDDIPINLAVDLDGEKIYTNQQRISRRKGYRISGNPNFGR